MEHIFEIRCEGGDVPDLEIAGYPRLAAFLPEGRACEELNCGQGEGQILIDGWEWGVYYNDARDLELVAHDTTLPVQATQAVADAIVARLAHLSGAPLRARFVRSQPSDP